jgi:NAD(P)-dependent dehydrogenase (short-subunit alcohol dehydrogenase family)
MPLALMTGGGSVIGEGIARCLAARGFTVAVTDIDRAAVGSECGRPAACAGARARRHRPEADRQCGR